MSNDYTKPTQILVGSILSAMDEEVVRINWRGKKNKKKKRRGLFDEISDSDMMNIQKMVEKIILEDKDAK